MTLKDQTWNLYKKSGNSPKITTKILKFFKKYIQFIFYNSLLLTYTKNQLYNFIFTAEHTFLREN